MAEPAVEDALHELDRATFDAAVSEAIAAERERCALIIKNCMDDFAYRAKKALREMTERHDAACGAKQSPPD